MVPEADTETLDQLIIDDPVFPGPADARLKGSRVHVWAIIGFLQAHDWDTLLAAQLYSIPHEEVLAAVAHYRRHKDEIDARLEANDADPAPAGA